MAEHRRLAVSTAAFGAATALSRVAGLVRESVAAAGYVTATSTRPGLCGDADDVLELPRITIHGEEPLPMFLLRLRTGRGVRETLRAVLGRPAQPRR